MKKIITASLVAMMAVTAANAEIASVEYVGKQTGTLADLSTDAKGNLTAAINEVDAAASDAATAAGNAATAAAAAKSAADAAQATADAANAALSGKQDKLKAGTNITIATDGTISAKDNIVNEVPDDGQDRVAPSVELTNSLISDSATNISIELENINTALSGLSSEDAQIRTDFAAADTATLNSAKAYADGLASNYDAAGSADAALAAAKTYAESEADAAEAAAIAAAATDATTKANAAQAAAIAAAKEAADEAYDVKGAAATAKTQAVAAAATDATTKADAAEAAAIAAAATDATTKANAAQAAAIAAAASDAAGKYQVKSDANYVVGMGDGTWKSITEYYAGLPAYCSTGTCSLVSKDGTISWEKVTY